MAPELRETGISVVGLVPWGTHFKHARARNIDVEITVKGEWVLTASDDGAGLDLKQQPDPHPRCGFGTMRERALAIGGRFEIAPRPGGGTSLVVRVPAS